jgi:hypothetical protein
MNPSHFQPADASVENALHHLGHSTEDGSMARLFNLLIHPGPNMPLRDLEPLVGAVVRAASPGEDAQILKVCLQRCVDDHDWPAVRRGGYLLDLLCYFGPHQESWQSALLGCAQQGFTPQGAWLDTVIAGIPTEARIPFYPGDSRDNPLDNLAQRWGLSSGVLYDRLNRLLRPPYVC